jgi:hypothetical protein
MAEFAAQAIQTYFESIYLLNFKVCQSIYYFKVKVITLINWLHVNESFLYQQGTFVVTIHHRN